MAVDDLVLREPFGSCGANVVLRELFEHGCSDHAGEDGGEREAEGDGWEDEVKEEVECASGARGGDGQPAEADGEDEDQDRAEREVGEREADEGDDSESAILPAVAMKGG